MEAEAEMKRHLVFQPMEQEEFHNQQHCSHEFLPYLMDSTPAAAVIQENGNSSSLYDTSNATNSATSAAGGFLSPDLLNLLHSHDSATSASSFQQLSAKKKQGNLLSYPEGSSSSSRLKKYFPLPQYGYSNQLENNAAAAVEEVKNETATTCSGISEFKRELSLFKFGDHGRSAGQHFVTEKQRREYLNDKYQVLRSLIPNPTKVDRASIAGDAVAYIKELQKNIERLKSEILNKRLKTQVPSTSATTAIQVKSDPDAQTNALKIMAEKMMTNESMRSTWVHKTSQAGTEVDVRIIHDEVTVKIFKISSAPASFVLALARILHELHLDILHVSGARMGDQHVFFFNTMIYQGWNVYAACVANRVIEALDSNEQ